ncbi:MAG: hypothetical protein U9O94_11190 [Nanoarchaeota archaeon]|nr:hypothetical protein [Nanoarchaeota archaeon]
MKFVKVFLGLMILLAPFVSAGFFDFLDVRSVDFSGNVVGSIAIVVVFIVMALFIGRRVAKNRREAGSDSVLWKSWKWAISEERKKKNENNVTAELESEEKGLIDHQRDVIVKINAILYNKGDKAKYEEKVESWASALKDKIKGFRKRISKGLTNYKHSYGFKNRFTPRFRTPGFKDPELVRSRIIQFFRSVVGFLQNSLRDVGNLRLTLDHTEAELDNLIREYKIEVVEAEEILQMEYKDKNETDELMREERREKARSMIERGKIGRLFRKEDWRTKVKFGHIDREIRAETKIERKSRRAEELAIYIREEIIEQRRAILVIGEVLDVIGKDVDAFEGNAKKIERSLKAFETNISKKMRKLEKLSREMSGLENKEEKEEEKVADSTDEIAKDLKKEELVLKDK